MKDSPLLAFLTTAILTAIVSGGEFSLLFGQFHANNAAERLNRLETQANEARRKDVQELQTHRADITAVIEKVVGSLSSDFPAPVSFEPFQQLGISVAARKSDRPDLFGYDFGPSPIEFHRFLPALNALENQYPLLRIVRLRIESNAEPFHKSAIAVDVQGEFEQRKGRSASASSSPAEANALVNHIQ